MSTLLYLVLAGVAGAAIGGFRPPSVPYAAPACILAALIVSVTLSLPLGDKGPHFAQVALLPAAIGAVAGALLFRIGLMRLTPPRDS